MKKARAVKSPAARIPVEERRSVELDWRRGSAALVSVPEELLMCSEPHQHDDVIFRLFMPRVFVNAVWQGKDNGLLPEPVYGNDREKCRGNCANRNR